METSIVTNQWPDRVYARPPMARGFMLRAWGMALAFMVVFLALFAPRTAEAGPDYLNSVILLNFSSSAQAYLCGNCHTTWDGGGPGFASRIDFFIHNGTATSSLASTNLTYLTDNDNDGRTNLEEIQMSQSTMRPPQFPTGISTGPNVANNWNWQIPDVDGDGCSHYLSRFTEAGVSPNINVPTSGVARASVVSTAGSTYRRFNPRGWDVDDNDASQGCSAAWTPTTIAVAPGTTTDNVKPGKVNTLSVAALPVGLIPLKWVPVGDDGNGLPGDTTGGKAHSYEIRYTTSFFANGTTGRNPRSPADWEIMHNIPEPDGIDSGGFWSAANDPDSLMQALYEPLPVAPTTPTTIQPCNARFSTGTMTCTAGASYDIKARGSSTVVNAIANGTTYWVAMWTHDGVIKLGAGGTLSTPISVTEQATLSNIIAVTAGNAGVGAAISSITPTTLSATTTVTVNGFGLNSTQAAQMLLTRVDGTVAAAAATPLTYTATGVSGTFNFPIASGTYNLELRTAGTPGVTKAAWVEAVTVGGGE